MKRLLPIIFIVSVVLFSCKKEEEPAKAIVKYIPLSNQYFVNSKVVLPDGSIIIYRNEYQFVTITKILPNGTLEWSKTFAENINYYNGIIAHNNDLYLYGHTIYIDFNSGEKICLLKLDATGDSLWTKLYGSNNSQRAECAIATLDGNLVLAGRSSTTNDLYLVKADWEGNQLWVKNVTLEYGQTLDDAYQTSDGGYVLYGKNVFGTVTKTLYKLDENGEWQWQKPFEFPPDIIINKIIPSQQGGFMLCGTTEITPGNNNSVLIKLDNDWNTEWQNTYGALAIYDEATSLIQNDDGSYTVVGISGFQGSTDVAILKVSSNGTQQLFKHFAMKNGVHNANIYLQSSGKYIVFGDATINNVYNLFTTRVDADGNFIE